MKCKDCKYFRREDDGDHRCESDKFVYEDRTSDDQLVYCDYESYSAVFYVGENFGCIHFKQKDS